MRTDEAGSRPAMNEGMRAAVPPPALFFVVLAAGIAANRVCPSGFLPARLTVRLAVGMPFLVAATIIAAGTFRTFKRLRTSPKFGERVSRLVVSGPNRISRNPLYLALALVLLGSAGALDNGWLVAGAAVLVAVLDRLVVRREERFLSDLFGPEYEAYRRRVRRWI